MSSLPKTPETTMKSKLLCGLKKDGSDAKEIAYIQNVNPFYSLPEGIKYKSIDKEQEMEAQGTAASEDLDITILYLEEQQDLIKSYQKNKTSLYWFLQYPERTAVTEGKPLTFYVQGTCALAPESLEIDGMIQEKIRIYKSSEVEESKGFPTETAAASN